MRVQADLDMDHECGRMVGLGSGLGSASRGAVSNPSTRAQLRPCLS